MREIEFRMYISKENTYKLPIGMIQAEKLKTIVDPKFTHFPAYWCWDECGAIWMQYTGLKDKNGVKIFNGDILSDKWRVEVYQNDEGTYMVRFHINPKINKPKTLKKYLIGRELAGTLDMDGVVIGNIYQNKELLCPPNN